jgi:hypothetical protein
MVKSKLQPPEKFQNSNSSRGIPALADGRTRNVLVKVHEVGEPAPEEIWLRANAVVFHETHLGEGRIVDFRPRSAKTF